MTLLRITMIGTLLLGFGCELPEESQLGSDERTEPIGLEGPMDVASDEETPAVGVDLEAPVDEAVIDDAELDELAYDEAYDEVMTDEAFGDGSLDEKSHKRACTYCWGKYCFTSTHPQESKAKSKAADQCKKKYGSKCKFKGCNSAH